MKKYNHNAILVNGVPSKEHALYSCWKGMRCRCRYVKHKDYASYGGRGIKVCERWNEFPNFAEDMGDRPDKHTLDRIDTNGDYEPSNCRWADIFTQANNTRKRKCGFTKGVYKNNFLGEKGMYILPNGKYRPSIYVDGKTIFLGCFKTIEEARQAKVTALAAKDVTQANLLNALKNKDFEK